MTLTHWKKLRNPDYMGEWDFQPGEKKTVTISGACCEQVIGVEGKKSEETVVHFREPEKPMILNVTNARMITRHAGTPYIEQWPGVRIILGVEKVKAFGDVVGAVRVQKTKPEQPESGEAAIPPCADCGKPIKAQGGLTAGQIAGGSMKRYNVVLCLDCATERKVKREANEHADNQNQNQ